jgi:ATP-dependent DNA helicase RecG
MEHLNTLFPDVDALLSEGMGPELHWFPGEVPASQLAAVLVGMANANGGTVLLGVAPRSNRVQGVRNMDGALDCIFQAALLAEPPLVLPLPRRVVIEDRQLLQVIVPAGLPHVYSLDGRYLGREGARTQPLAPRRLRQLLVERGVVQFESQVPPNARLDDLDPERVAAYLEALGMPAGEPVEDVLLRRGCVSSESGGPGRDSSNGELRPTYGALLLFGRDPQQWLPNATILAARFAGASMADRFIRQEISGTLPEQLRQAEAFVRENMRRQVHLVGLTRQEETEYPLEAVRELLVNAVAHRDYNVGGDNIHLNLYADRIEVGSPGGLPGPVTLENLLEARFSRNAVIVQVLSDLGYVERLGYGLDRVVEVLRQHGLRPPRFEELAGTFRVTLFGDPGGALTGEAEIYEDMDLNPRQQMALAFLLRRKRITNRDYQELCPDVSAETLRRDLVDLVGRDLILKIGDKRATYYILKKPA